MPLFSLFNTGLLILACSWAYVLLWLLVTMVINPIRSPLRNLPGPPLKSLMPGSGNLPAVLSSTASPTTHEKYVKAYGKTFRIYGFGHFDERLLTLDPKAMAHILNSPSVYEKPWQSQRLINGLIGPGLLSSEGARHRLQRKVLNPAFSNQSMKSHAPLVMSKARELRHRWLEITANLELSGGLDVIHWMTRATFDIIGLAGFDYSLNAIENEDNELYLAYKAMFDSAINRGQSLRSIASIFFPIIDRIWPSEAVLTIRKSHKIIYGLGNQLVQKEKQEAIQHGKDEDKNKKSILSLLMKSNLSEANPSQRIADRDIMDQINTFFFAGTDTTSLALGWTFLLLAQNPEMQTKLREEIHSVSHSYENDDSVDTDFSIIDNLPYLDKVTRESLRVIPPIHSSLRVACRDDVIPTQFPVKMKDGSETHSVPIRQGQFVHVSVEPFNQDKTVWGEDAWEFKPDRWDNLPEAVRGLPCVYSNIMTFLGGPRACIGFRLSIIEIKTFIYVLIAAFTFEPVPDLQIIKLNVVLTRPYVKGKVRQGSQLPLIVRPYHPA
ncbi:hypothetical protein FRB94_001626 [Tulasnella sp. JGI-2019a]|nr:hypothetical protein FRB93_011291 [Tulasnella sp. JGI-2019a]KAG9005335.1 hypothetical protein FRB94_001626 [Tulasnella sp. JGI-2019a]KAG9036856.1 hypothetical protein FRB95_007701 [Tulasnella sp. JGI-2019a]